MESHQGLNTQWMMGPGCRPASLKECVVFFVMFFFTVYRLLQVVGMCIDVIAQDWWPIDFDSTEQSLKPPS